MKWWHHWSFLIYKQWKILATEDHDLSCFLQRCESMFWNKVAWSHRIVLQQEGPRVATLAFIWLWRVEATWEVLPGLISEQHELHVFTLYDQNRPLKDTFEITSANVGWRGQHSTQFSLVLNVCLSLLSSVLAGCLIPVAVALTTAKGKTYWKVKLRLHTNSTTNFNNVCH